MKKILSMILSLSMIASFASCGSSDKYKEILSLLNQIKELQEKAINSSSAAENAKDYAKSLNDYSEKYNVMLEKLKSVKEKYPELSKDSSITGKAIKALEEIISENAKKIVSSSADPKSKSSSFAGDNDVKQAVEKITKISGGGR